MSTKKTDIALIRKYLNGELDARAMYDLERQAHNDPFLMDVIRGMEMEAESKEDHQPHLDAINRLIEERTQQDKKRTIPLWKLLPIAASLLIALTIGGWWLMRERPGQTVVLNHQPVKKQPDKVRADLPLPVVKPAGPSLNANQLAKLSQRHAKSTIPSATISDQSIKADTVALLSVAIHKDTGAEKDKDVERFGYYGKAQPNLVFGNAQAKLKRKGDDPLSKMVVRGVGTIRGKEPLYVVDGIMVDSLKMSSIKPDDIKSINVLKDASATALYGSRAANGVILIETKKGLLASNDVNIIGYRSQKKTIITASAATTINPVNFNKPDTSITQALAGRVAGVNISNKRLKEAKIPLVITGRVVDKHDGQPLPGVTIAVAGKSVSTTTDVDGNFKITAAPKDILNIAFIGYENQYVKVKDKDDLKIALDPAMHALSEVVVVGYGTQRKPEDVLPEDARPAIGWDAYKQYLKAQTVAPVAKAGKVKLGFIIDASGNITNVRVIKGLTDDANQRAINILKNGSKWVNDQDNPGKEIKLKINFHQ
ncbi:carboxypeptidase-like regulatory domain-containing protein [Mucilaginibacter paludis]|uniref:TonB-dependent receptor plug n=1 Tax=Mucilaginibacter paludis DSM 18603 TaxID=714943 RepID=H1Y4A0_9SPHI|nr:carboxypeptidase-like regulatory domain-containing protein [Mucilaginibacter paludis]EHQ25734.1 TonB-dependent receptor plug [Mucilaginibacter paludis DSM 18603]